MSPKPTQAHPRSGGAATRTAANPCADPTFAAARDFWQLPDGELDQLLTLAREIDRVELKLNVPELVHSATCAVLGVDFTVAPTYRVYYLDTFDLALRRRGLLIRVRSMDGRADDSVIKLRPVVPDDIPAALRRSKRFVLEIDAMPGSYVCSGALKARLGTHDVERAMTRRRPPYALFSEPQQRLLAARLPRRLGIDDLAVLGPVDGRRHKLVPEGFDRTLLAEQWTLPDQSRILELSTRCTPGEALQIAARTAVVLRAHGIDLTGPQQTKTAAALNFFSTRQSPTPTLRGKNARQRFRRDCSGTTHSGT